MKIGENNISTDLNSYIGRNVLPAMVAKKIDRDIIRNDNPITWLNQITRLLKSEKYTLLRDGWQIFRVGYFVKAGFPETFIRIFEKKHEVNTGPFISTIVGVHYLDFLYGLKTLYGIQDEIQKIGRGAQAGEIIRLMDEHLEIYGDER